MASGGRRVGSASGASVAGRVINVGIADSAGRAS